MIKSEQINELAKALSAVQTEIKNAELNKVNPHYKSRYADLSEILNTIRPVLAKNGLAFTQTIQTDQANPARVTIETMLIHSSGQFIGGSLTMIAKDSTPQAVGAVITYGRRFSAAAIVGIAADDDDDANSAQPDKTMQKNAQDKPIEKKQDQTPKEEKKSNQGEIISKTEEKIKTVKLNIMAELDGLGVSQDNMKAELQKYRDKAGIKKSFDNMNVKEWERLYETILDYITAQNTEGV